MRYIFKFPDIGEGITEGKIIEWFVNKGSEIAEGETLVKVETDKVVADIPSPKTGTIVVRYGAEGETINVEDPLVEIEIEGNADADALPTEKVEEKGFGVVGDLEVAKDDAFLPSSDEGFQAVEAPTKTLKKALATPVARAMAKKLGVDINAVSGSGPAGRVTKADIQKFVEAAPPQSGVAAQSQSELAAEVESVELSPIRKAIAKNMVLSKSTIPHMTVFEEADAEALVAARSRIKDLLAERGIKLTYLAFIAKAVAKALKEFPVLNAQFDAEGGRIFLQKNINLGIAIDTKEGLLVPVLRNANQKTIAEIASELGELSQKANNRELALEDLQGGTFTITNYGSIGGLFAVPVINHPQSAILGVGRLKNTPVVKNGEVVPGKIMPLSLAADHRIVDGGDSTRFLNRIIQFLQDPILLAVF